MKSHNYSYCKNSINNINVFLTSLIILSSASLLNAEDVYYNPLLGFRELGYPTNTSTNLIGSLCDQTSSCTINEGNPFGTCLVGQCDLNRKCVPGRAPGESCGWNSPCAHMFGETVRCVSNTCRITISDGCPCNVFTQDCICGSDDTCGKGRPGGVTCGQDLDCASYSCRNNTCYCGNAGDSCFVQTDCCDGFKCDQFGTRRVEPRCVKITKARIGEQCRSNSECMSDLCVRGRCISLFSVPENGPCTVSAFQVPSHECQVGLACVEDTCTQVAADCSSGNCGVFGECLCSEMNTTICKHVESTYTAEEVRRRFYRAQVCLESCQSETNDTVDLCTRDYCDQFIAEAACSLSGSPFFNHYVLKNAICDNSTSSLCTDTKCCDPLGCICRTDPPPSTTGTDGTTTGSTTSFMVRGRISNARHSYPIVRAKVSLDNGLDEESTFTDNSGFYTFSKVPPGRYKLSTLADGYYTKIKDIIVDGDISPPSTGDVFLAPIINDSSMLILLTWGAFPLDLDTWFLTENDCAVFFRNPSCDAAFLERDDFDGFGPETLLINSSMSAGRYEYWVHIFTSGSFKQSEARVDILAPDDLSTTVFAPNETDSTKKWWKVFDLKIDKYGNRKMDFFQLTYSFLEPFGRPQEEEVSSSDCTRTNLLLLFLLFVVTITLQL